MIDHAQRWNHSVSEFLVATNLSPDLALDRQALGRLLPELIETFEAPAWNFPWYQARRSLLQELCQQRREYNEFVARLAAGVMTENKVDVPAYLHAYLDFEKRVIRVVVREQNLERALVVSMDEKPGAAKWLNHYKLIYNLYDKIIVRRYASCCCSAPEEQLIPRFPSKELVRSFQPMLYRAQYSKKS